MIEMIPNMIDLGVLHMFQREMKWAEQFLSTSKDFTRALCALMDFSLLAIHLQKHNSNFQDHLYTQS